MRPLLFRVVVSFLRPPDGLHFLAERAILALTPGDALNETLVHLQIDLDKTHSLRTHVSVPSDLEEFSYDTQQAFVLNSPGRSPLYLYWRSR